MSYRLKFKSKALKEWKKLDRPIQQQFKKKLLERLGDPRLESARFSGLPDCYKIKLRAVGYRLVYEVRDSEVTVVVISVGKRDKILVYQVAARRI